MNEIECPKCKETYCPAGCHEDDAGQQTCETCGFKFVVEIEYEPEYDTRCVVHEYGEAKLAASTKYRACHYCGHVVLCEEGKP